MSGKSAVSVVVVLLMLVTGVLILRGAHDRYALGNVPFDMADCVADGRVPTFDTVMKGFKCTTPGGGTGLGYTIKVQALTSSPGDGATVYFGMLPKTTVSAAATSKVYIRKAGTIKIAELYCYSGTAGTGEAWSLYVRKNNTTDALIATLSVAANERVFTNSALSIAVVAGDYVEIKSVHPTWATNPLTTIYGGYLYVE